MNKYSVVCPDCGRVMGHIKDGSIGTYVLEMSSFGPYLLWRGDMYDCAPCDKQVVAGFGEHPDGYWQDGFAERVAEARAAGKLIEVRR
jgi:hypothetical protein